MSVNRFNPDEYKRIRKGFRIKAYTTNPISKGGRTIKHVSERKFETLPDLIGYIYSLKRHTWLIIANSNKRKTLFRGFSCYFKTETRDTDFGKIIYGGLTK